MFFEKLREVGGKKLNGFDKWVCFMLKVQEIYANICFSLLQSFVLCGFFWLVMRTGWLWCIRYWFDNVNASWCFVDVNLEASTMRFVKKKKNWVERLLYDLNETKQLILTKNKQLVVQMESFFFLDPLYCHPKFWLLSKLNKVNKKCK